MFRLYLGILTIVTFLTGLWYFKGDYPKFWFILYPTGVLLILWWVKTEEKKSKI